MKRLISARDVEEAAKNGSCLHVDANTIVTAQARDLAREHGVRLECGEASAPEPAAPPAPGPDPRAAEPALSANEMERVIRAALASGVWTERQLERIACSCGRA